MSIGAYMPSDLTTTNTSVLLVQPAGESLDVPVRFEQAAPDIWDEVDRAWTVPKAWADLRPERVNTPVAAPPERWRVAAEGIRIPETDYVARFATLPIDDYRRRMTPEVFQAYMTFIGVIEGGIELDLVEAADLPVD